MILPRRESKDILDSGSKSQRANEEQREICRLLTSGVQETSLSCVCLEGPAGSYANKELLLISLCYGVCHCILATGRSLFLRSLHICFTLF